MDFDTSTFPMEDEAFLSRVFLNLAEARKRSLGLEVGDLLSAQCVQLYTKVDTQSTLNTKHGTSQVPEIESFGDLASFLNVFNNKRDKTITLSDSTVIRTEEPWITLSEMSPDTRLEYINDVRQFPRTIAYVVLYYKLISAKLSPLVDYSYLILCQVFLPNKNHPRFQSINRFDIMQAKGPIASSVFEDTLSILKRNVADREQDNLQESIPRIMLGLTPVQGTDYFELLGKKGV